MKCCPNCKSTETFVADRCGYVICRKCGMTGPVAPVGNDEEAEKLWDGLPRADESRVLLLEQTLRQVHDDLRLAGQNGSAWRLHLMKVIKSVLVSQ